MRYRGLLLTFIFLFILIGTVCAKQQPSGNDPAIRICNHGGYELWDVLRVLPVQFIEFNSNTALWKYHDDYTVKLGAFVFNENAEYISREKKKVSQFYLMERKGHWLCYYCSHCRALLRAYELKPDSAPLD